MKHALWTNGVMLRCYSSSVCVVCVCVQDQDSVGV